MNHKDYGRYEMLTEETKDKGEKAKSADFGFAPMCKEMVEMMNKCCKGQGGFPDCSAMMKTMMETAKNKSCCGPKTDDTKSDREEK